MLNDCHDCIYFQGHTYLPAIKVDHETGERSHDWAGFPVCTKKNKVLEDPNHSRCEDYERVPVP